MSTGNKVGGNFSTGNYEWQVRAIDIAGNEGSWTSDQDLTIGITPPSRPNSLDLSSSDDTGYSSTDNITNKRSGLSFSWQNVSNESGYKYRYYKSGWNSGWQTSWDASENISVSSDGNYTFDVKAYNDGGESSVRSMNFTVDTQAPGRPGNLRPTGSTTDRTPTFRWNSVSDSNGIWKYELDVDKSWSVGGSDNFRKDVSGTSYTGTHQS